MTSAQKIGIAFALLIVVAFLGYRAVRENGLQSLRDGIVGGPSASPVAVESAAPSPGGTVPVMAAASVSAPEPVAMSTDEASVLASMNAQRLLAGVPACDLHPTLQALAQRHALDMARRNFFSHTDPDGVTFEQRVIGSGYTGTRNAENLGLTSGVAAQAVAGWMDSAGHRTNLLSRELIACGVGTAAGTWQGMSVSFVVAVFGNAK